MRINERYINPFTDFGFKKLFGTDSNKDILLDFLNELLGKLEGKIVEADYLPKEQLGRAFGDRRAIYDICCKNEEEQTFIVELQKAKQNYFKDRSIYYSTFPIQSQAKKGDWNFHLKSVYTVGILDFIFENEDKEVFQHEIQLFNRHTQKIFFDKLTYIYLEIPKFLKRENELETHFDEWLYVLKNLEHLTKKPLTINEKIFERVFRVAEIANYSEDEYVEYEESLKVYRDLKNSINTAFDEGELRGRREEKLGIAFEMLKDGMEIEKIVKFTKLPEKEVLKLSKRMNNG